MGNKASKLMVLYGLFVLFSGGIGLLSGFGDREEILYTISGAGILTLFIGNKMKNGTAAVYGTALALVCVISVLSAWQALHGWIAFIGDVQSNVILTVVLTMLLAHSAIVLPVVYKAWERQKRLESLF